MTDEPEKQFIEEDVITISVKEIKGILIKDIASNTYIKVASILRDDNGAELHVPFLKGEFGWSDDSFYAFVRHDWYRKYWDFPLGLSYHMDLMRRLVEFKQGQGYNIVNIEFEDDGDWCHLHYDIAIPDTIEHFEEAFSYAKEIEEWIDNTLLSTQTEFGKKVGEIRERYNSISMLEFPELIDKTLTAKNATDKGKYLEELIAKFFAQVNGFEVIERKRTKTEEIDLVIKNTSDHHLWRLESPLILVECKNWDSPVGKNEYVVFREKLENRRGRATLGFFVSANGFTKTFYDEDLRNTKSNLLIIPIELKTIIEIIERQKDFTEELQRLYVAATTI